jgi:hypothetical protein
MSVSTARSRSSAAGSPGAANSVIDMINGVKKPRASA